MNKKREPIFKMVNIRMTEPQSEELRRYAWDRNISMGQVIRETLVKLSVISPSVGK
jgi:hypothetical protein